MAMSQSVSAEDLTALANKINDTTKIPVRSIAVASL
ncbi:hypothetical protein Cylst_2550 [Cylindrospermum stagnale PCC 7417]|uniref:Uncharacterized protein n=1 Tax=Cylindrospermum stagnale PCC 7417 TaxID=56107 RepID=K9WZ14_9NOST|nr:hypothetical protein Cylst_2550 [Cylindrospermum stagnale PCC 7417]